MSITSAACLTRDSNEEDVDMGNKKTGKFVAVSEAAAYQYAALWVANNCQGPQRHCLCAAHTN